MLGYAKSIGLPTKVINLSLSAHPGSQRFHYYYFFLTQSLREKEKFARHSASSREPDIVNLARVFVFLSFSSFFFPLPCRSRGPTRAERWAGSIDGLRDDSVQRGVRNFHARTSRRAGQAAPAAHTSETHESGSLLVATIGGV